MSDLKVGDEIVSFWNGNATIVTITNISDPYKINVSWLDKGTGVPRHGIWWEYHKWYVPLKDITELERILCNL